MTEAPLTGTLIGPRGRSKAAMKRFAKSHRGTLYRGNPGDVIQMSDRSYVVADDGAFVFIGMNVDLAKKPAEPEKKAA